MKLKFLLIIMAFILVGCNSVEIEKSEQSTERTTVTTKGITTTTTAIQIQPTVINVTSLYVTNNDISFVLKTNDQFNHELVVELVKDGTPVTLEKGKSTVRFTDLEPETDYILRIGYIENNMFILYKDQPVTTKPKAGAFFKTINVIKNGIYFEFYIEDKETRLRTLDIEILNKDTDGRTVLLPRNFEYQRDTLYTNWKYEELKPLTNYCIRTIGETTMHFTKQVFEEHCFKTDIFPYSLPIQFSAEMIEDGIKAHFRVEGSIPNEYVKEYVLEAINPTTSEVISEIRFNDLTETQTLTGLQKDVTYNAKLSVVFDINGELTTRALYNLNVRSLPSQLEITNVSSMNQEVKKGEEFYLQINLANNSNIQVRYVTINGVRYSVNSNIGTEVSVKLTHQAETSAVYTVEKIEGTYVGYNMEYSYTENNSYEVKTMGEFNLYSIQMNNSSIVLPGQARVYKFNISNQTGYPVKIVKIGNVEYTGSSITQTNNEVLVTVNPTENTGVIKEYLEYIILDNGADGITVRVNEFVAASCSTNEIKEISTPSDLQNIQSGSYVLKNDLDMTGFNFVPIDSFTGCIDGKGYTISNLTIDTTNTDLDYASLFNRYSGILENLNFTNATIKSKYKSAIVVNELDGLISNVNVSGNLYATGHVTIGGIAISNYNSYILNSSANINAYPITDENTYSITIGGITAYNRNYSKKLFSIDSSHATMNIISDKPLITTGYNNYMGGIVGSSDETLLSRVSATLNMNIAIDGREVYVGGITGKLDQGGVFDSSVTGTVQVTTTGTLVVEPYTAKKGYSYNEKNNNNTLVIK